MFTSISLKNVKHGFFTRQGGVSQGLFHSLNFAFGKGDETNNILKNRAIALEKLDIAEHPLLTLKQVHSSQVLIINEPWSFAAVEEGGEAALQADAMVTKKSGIALGILTADCAPVLFADSHARVIGAAHAGWRGAKAGIILHTLQAMLSLGAELNRIVAVIGPCIAYESYEVGAEFYEAFVRQDPVNKIYFLKAKRENHFIFDLQGFVKTCLVQAGVKTVECLNLDTYAQPQLFFSCRRASHNTEPVFGNNISIIAL